MTFKVHSRLSEYHPLLNRLEFPETDKIA